MAQYGQVSINAFHPMFIEAGPPRAVTLRKTLQDVVGSTSISSRFDKRFDKLLFA
jgi:hypothetical protein